VAHLVLLIIERSTSKHKRTACGADETCEDTLVVAAVGFAVGDDWPFAVVVTSWIANVTVVTSGEVVSVIVDVC
jgi:hypothetical protein